MACRWIICVLLVLMVSSSVLAQTSALVASTKSSTVPEQDIETTLFDIYLGDTFQGAVLASYTDYWFEIDNANDVVEQIKVLTGDTQEVVALCSGQIPTSRTTEGIGSIRYDLNTFRIILNLDPRFLQGRSLALNNRIPDPERGFSFQQRVGIAASNATSADTQSAITLRTLAGSGKYFARAEAATIKDESAEITEASAIGFFGSYEARGGFLETPGERFASSLQYTGARLRTSQDILLDPDLGIGSPLQIYVPSRSRVEFYRNGRLLDVQILNFGLQEANTRSFPQGSYDVDIIINQDSGSAVRERRFFTKSGYLANRGMPVFSIDAGTLRNDLETQSGEALVQGSLRVRALDWLETWLSGYGTNDTQVGSAGTRFLYRTLYMEAGGSGTPDGDSGVFGMANFSALGINVSGGFTEALEVSDKATLPASTPTPRPGEPVFIPERQQIETLRFQDLSNRSLSASTSLGSFDLAYALQRNRYQDLGTQESKGPTLSWRLYEGDTARLLYRSAYLETDRGSEFNNGITLGYRLAPWLTWSTDLTYYDRDQDSEAVAYTGLSADRRNASEKGFKADITSEYRRTDTDEGRKDILTSQALGQYGSDFTRATAFARNTRGDTSTISSYGVNAESAFIVSKDLDVALSYPYSQESVLLALIDSSSTNSTFDVLINGQVRDTIAAGRRTAIGVSPFRTYEIAVRPTEGSELVDYEAKTYSVTVFPGNVVTRTWSADRVFILLGKLVDEDGTALSWQRIRGTREYTATESDGSFQAEISGDEELFVESKTVRCKLDLTLTAKPQFFVDAGTIICRETTAIS